MSIKAVGIAIKLTLEGYSQVAHLQSWIFATVSASCIITQLIYLNKVQTRNFILLYYKYYSLRPISIGHLTVFGHLISIGDYLKCEFSA